MMKYKLIACDLDGTLLNSNGDLSEENFKAIKELVARGVVFVPTTGRAFYETPESIRNHPSVRYIISSDGAMINDLKNGECFEFLLDGKTVDKIYNIMKECNLLCANHKHGYSLTDATRTSDDIMEEYNISPYFSNQLQTRTKQIANFEKEFTCGESCEMLSGCFKSSADADKFISMIKDIEGIHCASAISATIEIVSSRAGKRNAVEFLFKKLGFTAEQIITVGDSGNDLDMIKLTSNSIAMANANEEIKSVAGHIGCANDEHIARYILDNLLK